MKLIVGASKPDPPSPFLEREGALGRARFDLGDHDFGRILIELTIDVARAENGAPFPFREGDGG